MGWRRVHRGGESPPVPVVLDIIENQQSCGTLMDRVTTTHPVTVTDLHGHGMSAQRRRTAI